MVIAESCEMCIRETFQDDNKTRLELYLHLRQTPRVDYQTKNPQNQKNQTLQYQFFWATSVGLVLDQLDPHSPQIWLHYHQGEVVVLQVQLLKLEIK